MDPKTKQAIGVVLGGALGLLAAIAIISPKRSAEEMRIAEMEYVAKHQAEDAQRLFTDLQGTCSNGSIKSVFSGFVASCDGGRWILPLSAAAFESLRETTGLAPQQLGAVVRLIPSSSIGDGR